EPGLLRFGGPDVCGQLDFAEALYRRGEGARIARLSGHLVPERVQRLDSDVVDFLAEFAVGTAHVPHRDVQLEAVLQEPVEVEAEMGFKARDRFGQVV